MLETYRADKAEKVAKKVAMGAKKRRTVPAGRRPKPKVSQPALPVKATGSTPEDLGLPKKVLGIDTKKFMRLVKKRTSDDLHQSVDAVQAMSALRMFYVIEQCETGAKISDMNADDRVKMLNAIKGANASANDTLKALNITAATREEVDLTDEALERLSLAVMEDNLSPHLQPEYIRAQEDVARISGHVDEATQAEQQKLVNEVREPVQAGSASKTEDDKVTHVEETGIVGGLG